MLPTAPQTCEGIRVNSISSEPQSCGGKEQHHHCKLAQHSLGTCGSSTNLSQPGVPQPPESAIQIQAMAEAQLAYSTPPRPCRQTTGVPQSPFCASSILDQLMSVSHEADSFCQAAQTKRNYVTAAIAPPDSASCDQPLHVASLVYLSPSPGVSSLHNFAADQRAIFCSQQLDSSTDVTPSTRAVPAQRMAGGLQKRISSAVEVSDTPTGLHSGKVLMPLLASRDPRKQIHFAVGRAASHAGSHTTHGKLQQVSSIYAIYVILYIVCATALNWA